MASQLIDMFKLFEEARRRGWMPQPSLFPTDVHAYAKGEMRLCIDSLTAHVGYSVERSPEEAAKYKVWLLGEWAKPCPNGIILWGMEDYFSRYDYRVLWTRLMDTGLSGSVYPHLRVDELDDLLGPVQ